MGVPLSRLLTLVKNYHMKLVAGEKGLSNPVSWVHMVGSVEIAEFLKGGEIAFTTGLGLRENMTLLMLAETIYEYRASAMVINIGPYISGIPQEVITFGNDHDFPIFEVPWEVHMAEIMRIFSRAIQEQEHTELELATLLRCALTAPEREDLYVPGLTALGYSADADYTVCLCRIGAAAEERKKTLCGRFSNLLLQDIPEAGFFSKQDLYAAVLPAPADTAEPLVCRAAEKMTRVLRESETISLGIGSTESGMQRIAESFRVALLTLNLGSREEESLRVRVSAEHAGAAGLSLCVLPDTTGKVFVYTYASLGTAGLLFHIRDKEILERFYTGTVKPLADHDRAYQGNLMEVLEAYFYCSGSIQTLAQIFYVHRNTINYKLRKIEQILGCDLGNFHTRFELQTGILAGKIKDLL